jgi:hypothetical protein
MAKKYDPTRMPPEDAPMATGRQRQDVLHTWRNKQAPQARRVARIAPPSFDPAASKRRTGGPSQHG